jgi:hypothetical protein
MRTTERLTKLKKWLTDELCTGRKLKVPPTDGDITKIETREPRCYLAWYPKRADTTEGAAEAELSVCPSILVMPNPARARSTEEKRNDRFSGVNRPKDLSQMLSVSLLFCVWDPGARLPGFAESEGDVTLLTEGTEQGLFTLYNWMDDCVQLLLSQKIVPGTDLSVSDESVAASLYMENGFVSDKRPLYYGFVNVDFICYSGAGVNPEIEKLLT